MLNNTHEILDSYSNSNENETLDSNEDDISPSEVSLISILLNTLNEDRLARLNRSNNLDISEASGIFTRDFNWTHRAIEPVINNNFAELTTSPTNSSLSNSTNHELILDLNDSDSWARSASDHLQNLFDNSRITIDALNDTNNSSDGNAITRPLLSRNAITRPLLGRNEISRPLLGRNDRNNSQFANRQVPFRNFSNLTGNVMARNLDNIWNLNGGLHRHRDSTSRIPDITMGFLNSINSDTVVRTITNVNESEPILNLPGSNSARSNGTIVKENSSKKEYVGR